MICHMVAAMEMQSMEKMVQLLESPQKGVFTTQKPLVRLTAETNAGVQRMIAAPIVRIVDMMKMKI